MSNRLRNLTQIPLDVDYLPADHLLSLLRAVAAERDELFLALQNEQAKSAASASAFNTYPNNQHLVNHNHTAGNSHDLYGFPFPEQHLPLQQQTIAATAAAAATETTSPAVAEAAFQPDLEFNQNDNEYGEIPDTFKVDAVKKRIAKKSFLLVKKTPHNKAKKPYTELSEAMPNVAAAVALFAGFAPKMDTPRVIKWELKGEEVSQWLNSNKFIHPVKFDGKVIAFGLGAGKPFVYAWASYESLQARFDKKGASLSLKFRTKMVGSGRPVEGKEGPPSLAG